MFRAFAFLPGMLLTICTRNSESVVCIHVPAAIEALDTQSQTSGFRTAQESSSQTGKGGQSNLVATVRSFESSGDQVTKQGQVTGTVKSLKQHTVVVLVFAQPHPKSRVFALDAKTKVTGKLASDSRVTVYYHIKEKTLIADRITVWENGPPEEIEPHKQPPIGGAAKANEPNKPTVEQGLAGGTSGTKASAIKGAAKAAAKKPSLIPKAVKPEKPPEKE